VGKYALVAVMVALLIYWVRFAPVSVTGHKVGKAEIVAEVMGTGTLEARIQTVISSKIAGRIERMVVDQGDHASAGQSLLFLDDSELKQQVEIAHSTLSAAKVSVERVQTDQTRARSFWIKSGGITCAIKSYLPIVPFHPMRWKTAKRICPWRRLI
jgi:HlyD family secretion protein